MYAYFKTVLIFDTKTRLLIKRNNKGYELRTKCFKKLEFNNFLQGIIKLVWQYNIELMPKIIIIKKKKRN